MKKFRATGEVYNADLSGTLEMAGHGDSSEQLHYSGPLIDMLARDAVSRLSVAPSFPNYNF
jgi:hypothetical protein